MTSIATKARRLRGGAPLWADSPRIRTRVHRNLPALTCDVAVIGAGVSGAIAALMLAERGCKVVVMDRRPPVTGSTLASTAMVQFEVDVPLKELAEKVGSRRAERAYLRAHKAVSALADVIGRHELSCAWKQRDALYIAGNEMGSRALQVEAAYRAKIGLPATFLNQSELRNTYGIDRTGGIVSTGNAEVNPAQLAADCLRAAQALGAQVYCPHDAKDVVAADESVAIRTSTGIAIMARKAVFATGYETLPQIPHDKYKLISTWAIATQPLPAEAFWPTRCLIWEAADPYLYLRATHDNRIVAGGEDADFADTQRRDSDTPRKARRLLAKLNELLPNRDLKLDYAWAGTFADSSTGLPYLSELPDLKNCFALLGCGGNGITFSMVAGELIAAWVAGKQDPDGDVFA